MFINFYQSSISRTTKNYQSKIEESAKTTSESHGRTDGQTSDTRSDRQFERPIHLHPVCCSAKEQNKHDLQLESTECIRGDNQIQDEMNAITTLYATTRRLHDEIRSQGCLLFKSNNQTTQEVSAFHFRQCGVRIPMPTIRTLISSTNVHQCPENSNFITEETGTASDHLHQKP